MVYFFYVEAFSGDKPTISMDGTFGVITPLVVPHLLGLELAIDSKGPISV